MPDLIPASYQCPSCGEENETLIDPGGGPRQEYTEDCAVCCRPIVLRVTVAGDGSVTVNAVAEG